MASATIKLFLVRGDANRLRTAELSNWSGKAVAGPRSELEDLLERTEADHAGVYFLMGTDPDSGKEAVYIGEAEVIRQRLKNHMAKDYWNQVIYFLSKDENLTKAHIRYLEGRLIDQAHAAGRFAVINGQASGAKLPECDREDMEIFLQRMAQLLPVLGASFLKPGSTEPQSPTEQPYFHTGLKGLKAVGRMIPGGFLVLAGSQAVLADRTSCGVHIKNLRKKLQSEGILVLHGDHFTFAKDHEFSSPSYAAATVHGGNVNGLKCWRTETGQLLGEVENLHAD